MHKIVQRTLPIMQKMLLTRQRIRLLTKHPTRLLTMPATVPVTANNDIALAEATFLSSFFVAKH